MANLARFPQSHKIVKRTLATLKHLEGKPIQLACRTKVNNNLESPFTNYCIYWVKLEVRMKQIKIQSNLRKKFSKK